MISAPPAIPTFGAWHRCGESCKLPIVNVAPRQTSAGMSPGRVDGFPVELLLIQAATDRRRGQTPASPSGRACEAQILLSKGLPRFGLVTKYLGVRARERKKE